MARKNSGNINFDINIQGVKDAKELKDTMPALVKQFNQLAQAVDRVESARGGGASSVRDVKERVVMMNVKFIKKEINSLQQLGAEYGSIVNQINALEKQGQPVARLREQAIKQHERLRKKIIQRTKANERLQKSERNVSSAVKGGSGAMNKKAQQLDRINQKNKQVNQDLQNQPQYMRNASYVWLNAGYLIQDSPYGVRGMANNVGQLTTAWQLMNQRLIETNNATGQNVTAFGALKKTLMGPTGLMLIIGSLLPAALVLLDRHWEKISGSIGGVKQDTEDLMDTINEYLSLQRELGGAMGEDPFSLIASKKDLEENKKLYEEISQLHEAAAEEDAFQEAIRLASSSGSSTSVEVIEKLEEQSRNASQTVKNLQEEFGIFGNMDLDVLDEAMDELLAKIERAEIFLGRSPLAQWQGEVSQEVDRMIQQIDLFEYEGLESRSDRAKEEARLYLKELEWQFYTQISSGEYDMARISKEYLSKLKEALEEEGPDEPDEDEVEPPEEIEAQYDFRTQMMSDLLELRLSNNQAAMDSAYTTAEKIAAVEEKYAIKRKQLDREVFENSHERSIAELELKRAEKREIDKLNQDQAIFEMEMQNMLLREGIDNPTDHQDHLKDIRDYYDTREEIIRESIKDENKLKEALFKNDQQRQKAILNSEQTLQEARLNLIQSGAQSAIHITQAVANATDASARAQFNIQKVASASMAIVSGHLAYARTLANPGGFLNTPLAYAALVSGYAQAAAIMSQSYDSASATGPGAGGFSGLTSYRGFDFEEQGGSGRQPFQGSSSVNQSSSPQTQAMPSKVRAEFTDGFGRVVSEGTIQLQNENKADMGYWS